ncbi:hypothetical protein BGW36DRAFT_304266 [Talaromyces proteolyticus]|uniref:Uncharacterized protein n=1 Tax=Talaromyces proteolyticus TaxID=1131652 RepID=A0AAD4KIC3_9EURO|nr:uncharacterized protein BGW36DRAFT_304266 [Talaromyces proteolyticus]KAH8691824.1 hypothetical protein BGW36DRAFT_304266 [Talaromyces proteolyticus]
MPNILCTLSDPDVQGAIECGEGLIRDNLSTYIYQNFTIWQKEGFWFHNSPSLSASTRSIEERAGYAFRHAYTLPESRSDRRLRLFVSQTLLYFSLKLLMRETKREMEHGMLKNSRWQTAAKLSMDRLLAVAYPDEWDTMSISQKDTLRVKLHEFKRQGSRCWQAAGLNLHSSLFSKNHKKYPIQKLDIVINYVFNAHPDVVSIYNGFDELMTQVLCGDTVTAWPSRQVINDKVAATMLAVDARKTTPPQPNTSPADTDPLKRSWLDVVLQ